MNLVCLGEIVAAHGIKGQVKIKTYTADPQNISSYGPLVSANGTQKFTLKNIRVASPHSVITYIDGIQTRNDAEAIIGTELFIDRSKLPTLLEDEYYHEDLVGLQIIDQEDKQRGIVIGLQDYGAGVFLDIKSDEHTKIITLPFNKDAILRVDFDQKTIYVDETFLLV